MSAFKDIAKGGWHPSSSKDASKDGDKGTESRLGNLRGRGMNTVAGLMGKGKGSNEEALEHQSTPLSALKDPASFGPPPKRIGYPTASRAPSSSSTAAPRGLGAALSGEELAAKQRLQAAEEETRRKAEEEARKAASKPYTVNTTGINTAHLPKPPVRRPDQGPQQPLPPQLPPRLPPRQNSRPDVFTPDAPPPYDDRSPALFNQGALGRLGQAGVSVPGFNIGRTSSPPVPPRRTESPLSNPMSTSIGGAQLSELQSRFSRLSSSHSGTPSSPPRSPVPQVPSQSGGLKKKPPPPPPKKKGLVRNLSTSSASTPPPVPLSSKPKW